jgi:hypothetical protein
MRLRRRVRRHAAEQTWFEPSPLVWFEVIIDAERPGPDS